MRARTNPRVGPLAARLGDCPELDVDALLDDRGTQVIVCTGSGGVGKTTTSAALALRAAERGRKVVSRSGASRKSSAERVGGVSTTTRS